MYVYAYIYIYINLFILLININIERNERNENKFLSCILVILLVPITFSLASFELNYTTFWCIWSIFPNLRKLLKQVS